MTDLGFIVKMVIYKCRELGNPVTETLAAYVAQTSLNPGKSSTNLLIILLVIDSGRFYLEKQINQEEATVLVDLTISRLQMTAQPSLSK